MNKIKDKKVLELLAKVDKTLCELDFNIWWNSQVAVESSDIWDFTDPDRLKKGFRNYKVILNSDYWDSINGNFISLRWWLDKYMDRSTGKITGVFSSGEDGSLFHEMVVTTQEGKNIFSIDDISDLKFYKNRTFPDIEVKFKEGLKEMFSVVNEHVLKDW